MTKNKKILISICLMVLGWFSNAFAWSTNYGHLLLPMISILSNLRLDPRTHGMKDFVQNMLTEIKGIRLEKTYISDNFETIKDWYIESKSELPSIIQSITINKVL
jgi:hypothetical protein